MKPLVNCFKKKVLYAGDADPLDMCRISNDEGGEGQGGRKSWPIEDIKRIMWSQSQWEASKLISLGGDNMQTYKHEDGHCDSMTDSAQRPS